MKTLINHENNYLNYYFAGYFEGKGSIGISREVDLRCPVSKNRYRLRIILQFPQKDMVNLFIKDFGGKVVKIRNRTIKYPWRWYCIDGDCIYFLRAIRPFLLCKRTQRKIDLAIKFWRFREKNLNKKSFGKTGKLVLKNKKIMDTKQRFYKQMKKLNRQTSGGKGYPLKKRLNK